ncbi:MAG: hypothetical protein Q8R47_00010 [Nanoarchaeota archaeon]|nr:hypothetical protein [Nanoarchaeota archaeon]
MAESLENIAGNLRDAYKQIKPGTMLSAHEIMDERQTNKELRDLSFYTSDGMIYYLDQDTDTPWLAITDEEHNLLLQNIDGAVEQLAKTRNYHPAYDEAWQVISAPATHRFNLDKLQLTRYNEETSDFEFPTDSYLLNPEQYDLVEHIFGLKNLKMLKDAQISKTRIKVLNPEYIQKHAQNGPIARASWLDNFINFSQFIANVRNFSDCGRVCGVGKKTDNSSDFLRRGASDSEEKMPDTLREPGQSVLHPATKEQILAVAEPYLSGRDWKDFKSHIPEKAPALGDTLQVAHEGKFISSHSQPEFDQKIRALYQK